MVLRKLDENIEASCLGFNVAWLETALRHQLVKRLDLIGLELSPPKAAILKTRTAD